MQFDAHASEHVDDGFTCIEVGTTHTSTPAADQAARTPPRIETTITRSMLNDMMMMTSLLDLG